MKLSQIILAISILILSGSPLAKDIELSCISLDEQLSRHKAQKNKSVLLLESAFTQNNCPSNSYWSIEKAVATNINGLTIFYGPDENIDRIRSVSGINKKVIEENLPERVLNSEDNIRVNYENVFLGQFNESFEGVCGIKVLLHPPKNNRLWLISSESIPLADFCTRVAIIFAGHMVELKYSKSLVFGVSPK